MKYIKNFFIILITAVLLVCALTAYFTWSGPKSVVLVPFRMMLQLTMKYVIFVLATVLIAYAFFYIHQHQQNKRCSKVTMGCLCVFIIILFLMANEYRQILGAKTEMNGLGERIDEEEYESCELKEKADYSKEVGVEQCVLYEDTNSSQKNTLIIHMNYGGWDAQDSSMSKAISSFCEKEGFSFLRFACKRGENEKINSILAKSTKALAAVLAKEHYEHVYLYGGSAGGHIALLSAFKSKDADFDTTSLPIDGVIAVYPCVDPGKCYDTYVTEAKPDILDRLGNAIYCGLYNGKTGTLGGETRILDEKVFGKRGDADSFYDATTIKNCLMGKDIPVLLIQGDSDSMVVPEATKELYVEMKSQNKKVAYLELPGVEHVFDQVGTAAWDKSQVAMDDFIRRVNK